jgi:predicted transcriptional regulator
VIECGKDGNHIHAHCVMMLNPELNKSNKTWISKGNVSRDLRAVWNKLSRDAQLLQEDCLKSKFAIQTILIKNERMLQDKLDYLIEELKPLSHQNLPHPQLPEISGEW